MKDCGAICGASTVQTDGGPANAQQIATLTQAKQAACFTCSSGCNSGLTMTYGGKKNKHKKRKTRKRKHKTKINKKKRKSKRRKSRIKRKR
jgi:hypothetical protein